MDYYKLLSIKDATVSPEFIRQIHHSLGSAHQLSLPTCRANVTFLPCLQMATHPHDSVL